MISSSRKRANEKNSAQTQRALERSQDKKEHRCRDAFWLKARKLVHAESDQGGGGEVKSLKDTKSGVNAKLWAAMRTARVAPCAACWLGGTHCWQHGHAGKPGAPCSVCIESVCSPCCLPPANAARGQA